MRLWKIIATATAVELALGASVAAILGLGGAWSGWLDILNNFAPLWFALCILAAPTAALLMETGRARSAVTGLAIVGAVVSGVLVLPEMAASIGPFGRGGDRPLKIVTFNTWSNNQRPDDIVARVRAANPDAFALIEMDWPFHHEGIKAFARDYPFRTIPQGGCPSDMQIFSKRPFRAYGCQVTYDPARPGITEGIVWGRTTAPDGRPFTFAATHYAWPFPGDGQRMQMAALARWVKAHGDRDLILVGDFNLTPWSFALRRQDGLLRPLRRQDHAIFTWPAMIARVQKPAPFAFLPIDHIYAGAAWRAVRFARLPLAGSDHYGIEAVFGR
jgi:endonuclease/exonuclease/phosphatase (EEP) superfamily protein YafD